MFKIFKYIKSENQKIVKENKVKWQERERKMAEGLLPEMPKVKNLLKLEFPFYVCYFCGNIEKKIEDCKEPLN